MGQDFFYGTVTQSVTQSPSPTFCSEAHKAIYPNPYYMQVKYPLCSKAVQTVKSMMDAHLNLLITRSRPCSIGLNQENHLLLGSSAPPLEGGSGGCLGEQCGWELCLLSKGGGRGLGVEGLKGGGRGEGTRKCGIETFGHEVQK